MAYRPTSAPRYLPRKLLGDSTACTHSGRVVSASGLSAVDVDTASVAYVQPRYASRTATTSRRPVAAIASRNARSLASEPEFTRNTVSSESGSVAVRRSLYSTTAAQLSRRGVGHARVAVAEHRDVVDHVEVHPAGRRHQEVPPAALDLRGPAV